MAIDLTTTALARSKDTNKTPILLLEIDGVPTVYGNVVIQELITIGCPGLLIGGFTIGGSKDVANQESLISFKKGTTTRIRQTLRQDKGSGETISSMRIALIDKNGEISELITPSEVVEDILGRRCKLWLGFEGTNFKDDFHVVFRGFIDQVSSEPGLVLINVAHPDQKKRGEIFIKGETELSGTMGTGDTVANVDDTTDFLTPVLGPSGVNDTSLKFYIRINDEIMRYEATSGTQFQTLTRAQLGTVAAAHAIDDTVESFYRLEGNSMDLALKLMLSGVNGPYEEDEALSNFVRINASTTVANSILFKNTDIVDEFNVQVGDFITTTGASDGANNVTLKAISAITLTDTGSYIEVTGVTFVEESDSAAVIDFRSQYDTLGEGLSMQPDEVDIDQHTDFKSFFLSSFDYDFYLKDTITGRKFLSEQIYLPSGSFSIPRKARASLGIHQGPLPSVKIKTLTTESISNPTELKIERATNRNFYNTFVHKWETLALDDKTTRRRVAISTTSQDRIPIGTKTLTITADGMRDALSALNLATSAQDRYLRKYKFGAETFKNIKLNMETGFDVEIGDTVLLDLSSIQATDIQNSGSRTGVDNQRLFEIENKTQDIATGRVQIDIIDSNFDKDARFCVFSPASLVKSGASTTVFTIKPSFLTTRFGTNEWRKWESLIGASIKVRNSDYSINDTAILASINGNEITLETALSFTPLADYTMELDKYVNQPAAIKLVFGFWSDGSNNFADGGIPYQWY